MIHDLVVTAAAIAASFFIRFEADGLAERAHFLTVFLPIFVLYASFIYSIFGLYRSKWRFASLPDLYNIFRAVSLLALSLIVIDYVLASTAGFGKFYFGKITIFVYWCLQMLFLGGPRITYRYYRFSRSRQLAREQGARSCLVLGRSADAELVIRAVESGAVRRIWPVGVLSPSAADQDSMVRNVRILGGFEDLETVVAEFQQRGSPITQLILTSSALDPAAQPEILLGQARQLGLDVKHLPGLEQAERHLPAGIRLARIDMEDLLVRPSVHIDYERVEQFARGKAIAVTGGGGSIGSEICNRVLSFGAARLLVIENSEPALRAVLDELASKIPGVAIEGRIGDVRDRRRMFRLIAEFKPDLVFHAAALKQVPIVEKEWTEAVRTNVFGSVNVVDAAIAAGTRATVMVSTDKAIEPVSVLGATKRFAEMYCQALDADLDRRANAGPNVLSMARGVRPRLISVRFGNVLASNGSVVPKFKAQIEAGGPVTITHPDMVRYFMTIREASDLVVTAASHALASPAAGVAIYVLNMGQPVRIVDLAERMIRLSGLEPRTDIEIVFTGIRPGERLNEILFARNEPIQEIGISGIVAARPNCPPLDDVQTWLHALEQAIERDDRDAIFRVFSEAVPDFRGAAA
jgi:O-antigen biosynthesis protein WbqV